ncbi:DUF1653 domain-containing protein [Roseburia hominis]
MNKRRPRPGECYRHFKGNRYRIITIAKHTETGEELVIYQSDEGDGDCPVYARELTMFLSKTDKEKYPDAQQEYRFELEEGEKICGEEEQRLILEFLDLRSSREKAAFLQAHKQEMTDRFLAIAAQSLDVTECQETLEMRYQDILHVLRARMKYEKR